MQAEQDKSTQLHFQYLTDARYHGFYFNTFPDYFKKYPFIRESHSNDHYSIMLIKEGEGIVNVNNQIYPILSGSILLIAPNMVHSFEMKKDWIGKIIIFCRDFYVEEFSMIRLLYLFSFVIPLKNNSGMPCLLPNNELYEEVSNLTQIINQEYYYSLSKPITCSIMRSYLNALLLKLTSIFESKSDRQDFSREPLIANLSHLLETHFIKEHQIGFYADLLHLSESKLNELCTHYFQGNLKKLITDRLILEARKLLTNSALTVSEIAHHLNFSDNSHFVKIFKCHTGITPKKFRDIHQKLYHKN